MASTEYNFDADLASAPTVNDKPVVNKPPATYDFESDLASAKPKYDFEADLLDPVAEEPETTLGDRAKDAGITALKGIIAVPETAVGLADIPTGGRVGKALQENGVDFKRAKDILSGEYSPAQKKAFQNVQEAEGFVPTLKAVAENPSVAGHTILESAPSMLGAQGIAKGVMKVAPKLSPLAAGAIGEGGVTAGQNVEQVRQQTEDGLLTPEQTAILAGSGALTGAITGVAGKYANELGVGDINTTFIGGQNAIAPTAKNAVRRGLESGLVEAGQETAQSGQEQATSNLALGRDIGEGVGNAAALGAVAGFGMGAPTGVLTRAPEQPSTISPEEQAVIDQQQGLLVEPENTAVETSPPDADNLLAGYLPADTTTGTQPEQVSKSAQAEEPENTDDQTILRESQDFVDAYKKAYTPAGRTQQVTKRLAIAASKLGIQANRGDSAQSVLDAMEAHIAANKIPTLEERTSEALLAVTEPLKEHLASAPDGIFNRAATTALDNGVAQPQIEAVENVKQQVEAEQTPDFATALQGLDDVGLTNLFRQRAATPEQKQAITAERERRAQSQESQNAVQDQIPQPTEQLNDQSQNTAPQEKSPEKGQEVADTPIDDVIAKEHPLHDANGYQPAENPADTKKAFANFQDLPVAIENPAGSQRSGKDESGKPWAIQMQDHYGEIKTGEGADGDAVDVFIPTGLSRAQIDESDRAYVIDQVNPKTGKFDEHKVVLGVRSEAGAREVYLRNYEKGWKGLGAITEMPMPTFKQWVKSEDKTKPVAEQRVAQDRRQSVAFLSPSERRIMERRQLAREAGLKDEAAIEKIVPKEDMDAVTGFHLPHDKEPTVKAAMEHVAETGEPAHFVEADIANLGGLNSHFNNNHDLANQAFRQISDIFADEMKKAGSSVTLVRHGGDELSAVVIGGTESEIKAAMARAKNRVNEYAESAGLNEIPHPKSKPGAEKPNGVSLYLGQSPIIPGTDLSSIFELSSRELDAGKRGEEYVRRNQTGTTGDIASSGSPSTDNGGPSKKAKRVKSPTGGKRGRAGAATPSEGVTEAKPAGITEALLQQPEVHEYLKSRFATQEEAIAHLVNKFGPGINTLVANGTLNFTQGKEGWPGGEGLQSDDEAIYFKGKAHIDLAATPPHRLAAVVLHEIGEHFNLRRMLGTDGYSSLQKQITNLAKIEGSYAQRIWNEVAQSYDHLEVGGEPFVAEVIAKMGEYAPNAGWFKRLISQIKSFLVTHGIGRGFITGRMGEKDIHDLLRASLASAATHDINTPRVFNYGVQQSRRLHGIRKSVEDFIVPETPQFEGNMNGVIAMTPREAVSKGVEQLPIKLRVGVATAEHKGFGITHIHDNAIREKDRRTVPGYTSEVAENYARHVSSIAKGFDQIFRDKGHLIFRSSRLQQALVVSKQADKQNGGQVYSVVSIIPAPNTNRWGGVPVWSGKRTETEAQLRTGRNVQSSPFRESDIEAPMFSRPSEPAPRFYSALSKAIEKAPEKVFGNAQQVKVWLVANAPKFDVKKDEVYWSGVLEYLDIASRPIPKDSNASTLENLRNITATYTEMLSYLSAIDPGIIHGDRFLKVPSNISSAYAMSVNRMPINTENTPNFRSFIASGGKDFSSLDIDTKRVVMMAVRFAAHDLKVFNSIIELVPVDMVDILIGRELPADMHLHGPSMLKNIPPIDMDAPVSAFMDRAFETLVSIPAFHIAEVIETSTVAARRASESLITMITNDFHAEGSYRDSKYIPYHNKYMRSTGVSRAQVSEFLDANGVKVVDKVLSGFDKVAEEKLNTEISTERARLKQRVKDAEEQTHLAILRTELIEENAYTDKKAEEIRKWKEAYRAKQAEEIQAKEDLRIFERKSADRLGAFYSKETPDPKHDNAQLTLPGGVDYRELVVTIPTTEPYSQYDITHFGDVGEGKQIGWIRHNTRIDANGNKVLFLEEVQSQRSQAGRKLGFGTKEVPRWHIAYKDGSTLGASFSSKAEAEDTLASEFPGRDDLELRPAAKMVDLGVPAAPFVTDSNNKATNAYISLLMKKAISQAIDSDSASVAWTTGDQQADRYDLSQKIDHIDYRKSKDDRFELGIVGTNGEELETPEESYAADELDALVGKDIADKIRGGEGELGGGRTTLRGIDLKIGGDWAKAMYGDENGLNAQGKPALITQAAMEIARKMGGKIESVPVVIGIPYRDSLQGKSITPEDQKRMKAGGRLKDQPALIITPEMKEKILSEGMPMFSRPSRSTREAVAEHLPEGLRVAASELQDKKDNLLETLSKEKLAFLSVRQIIESAKSYLPGLKTYEEGMQRRRAMVDPYLHKANQITTIKWKGLPIPARKETGRIMQQSTLRDINVSKDWLGVEKTLRSQFKAYSMTEFNGESRTALTEAADQAGAILSDKNSATFATQEEAQQFLAKLHEIDRKQTEKRARNGWKDPNILRWQSYANLKPAYDALVSANPEAAKIYSGTYELHQEIFNARLEALEHRIEESMIDAQTAAGLIAQLRIKFESQSLSWYYAPLKRYGDHWFYGKDAQGENWFMTYESLAARKRAVKNFEAEGGTVRDLGTSLSEMQNAQIGDAVSDNFLKNIHEKIDAADIPIEVSKELQDEIHQMYLATLPDISVRHNAMHRKGTKGFDEDAMRAFANTIHHGASQLANMVEGRNMGESLRDAKLALDIATKTSTREAKRTEMQAAEMLGEDWDGLKAEGVLEELRDNATPEEQGLYEEAIKLRNKFSHLDITNKVPKALFIAQKNLSEATTARERVEASDALKTAEKISSFWAQYQDPQRVEAAIVDILATGTSEQVKRFRKVQTLWEDTVSVGSPEESLERVAVRNKGALKAASHINTENSHKAAYAIEELNKTYNAMVNTSSTGMDQVAAAIRQFDFVMTMGFGLSSGLVNLFQTPVVAMPIAVGKYGVNATRKAFGNTRNEFLKAVIGFNKKDANGNYVYRDEDGNVSISTVMEEKLAYLRAHNGDPREILRIARRLAALRDFKEEGDVSRTNFFDVLGIGREGEDYGGRLQEFNKKMGWMFHHGERMNREITLLAAYDLALNGDPENHYEALEYARKLNNDAHGDYSTENAARIFRGPVAGVVMQYKKYPQAMLYLWGRTAVDAFGYWKKMPRNTPEEIAIAKARKAEAKEAARSLSALFAMQGAAAGLFGMPLMGAITMVLNALGNAVSDDDEPWDVEKEVRVGLTDIGGETFATAVIKGLGNALTPVNLASRMNLSNIFFQEPLKDVEGKDAATEYLSQAAGPFGGMIKKIADGAKMLGDGEIWRGVESATPKAIGDGMKAIRLAQSGYESMNGEQLKDASAMEVLFQAIGLGSSNMEVLYAERGYNKAAEAAISDARAKLVNKIQKAVTKGEPIPQEELNKWQKDHPSWPITYESIHKSAVRTAKNEQARGIRGYAVNPRLAYLYEQNQLREENED